MNYRRPAGPHTLRLLFVTALLVLGVLLPFASAMLTPAAPGLAAAMLPTAYVRVPTQQPALVSPATSPALPTALAQPSATPAAVVSGAQASDVTPSAAPASPTATTPPTATALPAPTATITPVELSALGAQPPQPVATLFPTQDAGAPAAPAEAGSVPPILMYHYIRVVDAASDPLGYELSISPSAFDSQMAWLHEQGYHGVGMEAVTRCLRGEAACPAKAVALTFDDGYADAYTDALPTLQRYGLSATFYIISGMIGQPGYMSWEQVAALHAAGMEIGAHTVSHPDLTSLDEATANYEISHSKAEIEQHLGISVASFCYPTGLYNAAIEEQVRAAGYHSATTTRWDGDYSDIMALPRRRVSGDTTIDGFVGIVQG